MLSANDLAKIYEAASLDSPDPIGTPESAEFYKKVKAEIDSAPPEMKFSIPNEFPDVEINSEKPE